MTRFEALDGPDARHPVQERAAIGLVLGCEGGHSDRLRVRHLLIDRVEIPVLERPQRDVHLGDSKGVVASAVSSTGNEDVLTAVVVERFPGESAIESFEAQAPTSRSPSHSFLVAHQSEPVPPSSKVMSTRLSLTLS